MKIAITFLLMFGLATHSFSQITFTFRKNGRSFGSFTSVTPTAINYVSGSIYIVAVMSVQTGTPPEPVVTQPETGQTFSKLSSVTFPNNSQTARITVFYWVCDTSFTGTINFSWSSAQAWYGLELYSAAGRNIRIAQVVSDANVSADPLITLGSLSDRDNAVIGFFMGARSAAWGTPETGWTEGSDWGQGTVGSNAKSGYVTYRADSPVTDNTVQFTAVSTSWAGIALELRASRRNETL